MTEFFLNLWCFHNSSFYELRNKRNTKVRKGSLNVSYFVYFVVRNYKP
jgi:hypothetical protein